MKNSKVYSSLLMGAAMLTIFLTTALVTTFGLLFEGLLLQLRSDPSLVSWIFNAAVSLQAISSLAVAPLVYLYGHRAVSASGGILVFFGLLSSSFARETWHLLFSYTMLVGIGTGLSLQAGFLVVSERFAKRRGLAIGIFFSAAPMARILVPPLEGTLLDHYGARGLLLIMAAIEAHIILAAMIIRPKRTPPRSTVSRQKAEAVITLMTGKDETKPEMSDENSKLQVVWMAVKKRIDWRLLKEPILCIFVLSDVCFWFIYPNFSFLLPQAILERGEGIEEAAFYLTMTGAGDLGSRLIFPPLIDRKIISPRNGFILGEIFAFIALLCFPLVLSHSEGKIICSLLYGAGSGMAVSFAGLTLIEYFGAETLPSSTGLSLALKGVFLFCLGPLNGLLKKETGNFEASCFMLAGGMLLGIIVWTLVPLFSKPATSSRCSMKLNFCKN